MVTTYQNTYRNLRSILALTTILAGSALFVSAAHAADAASAAPAGWWDTMKFSGHVEGGAAFNVDSPKNNENVGSLFTDKSNQPQLNQAMLTLERPIDSASPAFNMGFKLQGLFGTDARYTHSLAETDHLIHSKYQVDVNEATVNMHLPIITAGGVDLKIGQFPSPMGAESIDASANALYSHSYIFNFGPFKSTGALATAHLSDTVDFLAGFDTGENGGITNAGNNNKNIKGQFGVGLNNLMDGKLTVLAMTHFGTENPTNQNLPNAMRYLNDVTLTYKANDALTLTTDVDYLSEENNNAIAYGVAQYASYVLNDKVTINARGEVWRDNAGFFAGGFPGSFDSANLQRGITNTAITLPRTTYGEATVGISYKPGWIKYTPDMVIRPELRVDHSFNNSHPFNAGNNNVGVDNTSFTPAIDIVVPF